MSVTGGGRSDVEIIIAVLNERLDSIEGKLSKVLDYIDLHQGRIAEAESRLVRLETSNSYITSQIAENKKGIEYNLKRSNSQDITLGILGVVTQAILQIFRS